MEVLILMKGGFDFDEVWPFRFFLFSFVVIVLPPDCKESVFVSVVFRSLVASRYISVCGLSWMVPVCGGDCFFVPCHCLVCALFVEKKDFFPVGWLDAVVESPFLRHTWVFLGSLSLFFFWLCHMSCRISVPWPETEPGPWKWKPRVLTTRPPANSLQVCP